MQLSRRLSHILLKTGFPGQIPFFCSFIESHLCPLALILRDPLRAGRRGGGCRFAVLPETLRGTLAQPVYVHVVQSGEEVLDPDVLDGVRGPHVGLGGVHKLVVDHLLWRGVSAKEDRRGVNIGDRSMTIHGAVAPPPGNGVGHVAKQSVAEGLASTLAHGVRGHHLLVLLVNPHILLV